MKREILLESLYRDHAEWIYKKLVKMGCTPEEAEDAMQNAYIIAYENFDQLRSEDAYVSWFLQIAIRTAYRIMKKNRRARLISMEIREEEEETEFRPDDWQKLMVTDDVDTRLILQEAFLSLPEKYRIPLCLHLQYNYKYEEIAKILGIQEGTVKSRISRAKTLLRKMLAEESEEAK